MKARHGLLVGLAGAAAWTIALLLDPERALGAYLTAYMYGLGLALGALCLVMIAHVTGAGWFVAVRRLAETVAATLPAYALLLLPLLLGMEVLYPWARPLETLSPALQEAVAAKEAYLNGPFFVARAVLYLGVWAGLGWLLWSASVQSDPPSPVDGDDPEREGPVRARDIRARRGADGLPEGGTAVDPVVVSAIGLPAFAFTVTFAVFDWMMSLEPAWHSTIFGIYYFSGAFLSALAVLVLLAVAFRRGGLLPDSVAAAHHHALGRLLLTFVVFWAYIAFSQGLIVWITDIPAEAAWYLVRWEGGWSTVLVLLGVGHFVLPFLALLGRDLKRRPERLAAVAAWLLLMHWVDLYWLVAPAVGDSGPLPGWENLAALALVLGVAWAMFAWRLAGRPAVPAGDPRLADSLRYESR